MPPLKAPIEKPRKHPVQQRSTATVEAILDATIQVLVRHGKEKLTTTLVAYRAGVSVGTLYQYFPNKRSLLQACLRRKLLVVTEAVEHACTETHGKRLADIVTTIADAFFYAKIKDPRAGLALYAVSTDVDGIRVTEDLRERSTAAIHKALASAPEKLSVPINVASFMLQSGMTGVSRRLLETHTPPSEHELIRKQTVALLVAYANSVTSQR